MQGCDGSLLLDETPTMRSEKAAGPNNGSALGFPVVDDIKAALENACLSVVSCFDILALAAEISVELAGGPYWRVMLGRRDGMAANFDGAQNLPNPKETLRASLSRSSPTSASTTPISSRCKVHTRSDRIYNFSNTERPDPTLDQAYLAALRERCPAVASDSSDRLNDLDPTTPDTFDNRYYADIQANRGLLRSDQAMLSAPIVRRFADSQADFFHSFATAMIKMGNIAPLTGGIGEVRRNCRVVN
ncbi:hypothetical protein U9M48_010434 [Paspalum notatum var. saurae]|uniref:Plant heme peroxidase family profile domain-containing protein n=1 Tax=Paspalum notatum var. saurae TaxID=547442 RepID=A0AAQ3SUS8_PASNO